MENLNSEDHERYAQFWRKFKLLDNLGWFGLGILLLTAGMAYRIPWLGWWYFDMVGLGFWLIPGVWIRTLSCPRCGVEFCGGLSRVLNPFDLGKGILQMKCYGCDLRREELAASARFG